MRLFLSLESLPPPPWYILRIFQLYLPQQKSALWCTSSCFFTMCMSVVSTSLISLHCFAHAHPAVWMAFLALNQMFLSSAASSSLFSITYLNINASAKKVSNSVTYFSSSVITKTYRYWGKGIPLQTYRLIMWETWKLLCSSGFTSW